MDVVRRYLFLLIEFDNLLLRLSILLVANKQYPKCLQIPLLLPPWERPWCALYYCCFQNRQVVPHNENNNTGIMSTSPVKGQWVWEASSNMMAQSMGCGAGIQSIAMVFMSNIQANQLPRALGGGGARREMGGCQVLNSIAPRMSMRVQRAEFVDCLREVRFRDHSVLFMYILV